MPPESDRAAETRAWFQKAALDLSAAEFELTGDASLAGDIVFHAQQAAEKAMKGLLVWHDRPFRKTHDLAEIGAQCGEVDPTLTPICRRADPLTVFAWAFRYPGDPDPPSAEEARAALALAREVYEAMLARLPREVRP